MSVRSECTNADNVNLCYKVSQSLLYVHTGFYLVSFFMNNICKMGVL